MQSSTIIRIENLEIENIKNVGHGFVSLNEKEKDTMGASVTGIYGQNGSGKTALIWAVGLIKNALSGLPLPKDTGFYILQGESNASIKAEFQIQINNVLYCVGYSLKLKKLENNDFCIASEIVDYKTQGVWKTTILNIVTDDDALVLDKCLYGPEVRLKELSINDKQIKQKLMVVQALSKDKKTSFFFNDNAMALFKGTSLNTIYYDILDALTFYGRMNLFVLNKNSESSFNMQLLPLSMRFQSNNQIAKSDAIPVGLGQNNCDEASFDTIEKIVKQIDVLIGSIIPGLEIEIKRLNNQLNEKGELQIVFELVSNRNGVITPLRYESEGIKKILCILSSLIAMYNDQSIFVAIDEMDAGIFEYLLGEILSVISQTGKGQLLFTSHNMRPLEVLDKSNIYFTTTNPNNKYIQFVGIKQNNNLRDTLLRTIDLGGQKESVYENTSSYQIGKAFRKAGELSNVKI